MILLETKAKEDRARQVMKQIGFWGYKVIPPVCRKEGIRLIRKNSVQLINFVGPSGRYFHSLFKIFPISPEVVITRVHSPAKSGEKNELWKELNDNPLPHNTPWMVVRDLNEVVNQSENLGGRSYSGARKKFRKLDG